MHVVQMNQSKLVSVMPSGWRSSVFQATEAKLSFSAAFQLDNRKFHYTVDPNSVCESGVFVSSHRGHFAI